MFPFCSNPFPLLIAFGARQVPFVTFLASTKWVFGLFLLSFGVSDRVDI
jgi:hypothetical protein